MSIDDFREVVNPVDDRRDRSIGDKRQGPFREIPHERNALLNWATAQHRSYQTAAFAQQKSERDIGARTANQSHEDNAPPLGQDLYVAGDIGSSDEVQHNIDAVISRPF